jgi:ketosteroid isomerase-like protein
MALREDLCELERGFWEAVGDPDYYREHMADDGLAVFSMGVMGKEGAIQSTSESQTISWTDIRIEEPRILEITDDVAAIVYKGLAKRDGEPYEANCTSVYARRDGAWQLVLHQQSVIEMVAAKA